MATLVSIVCPVHNEEDGIDPFYERLTKVLGELEGYEFELVFTNNRSTDATLDRILALREKDPRVQVLTFSRDYGYEYSVLAGLKQASGKAMIVIDVDLEDPPELIRRFIDEWRRGSDIVYGERDRRQESLFLTLCRKIFYRLNRLVADSDIILDMAEFALISSDVRDAVAASASTFPFVRAEIAHYGFRRTGIRYDRERRRVGRTHYGFVRMTKFAIGGILSSTTFPLRMAMYLLPAVLIWNAAWLAASVCGIPHAIEAMIAGSLSYLATAAAFSSLYLARAYRNITGRPIVVVDWALSATNRPREESPNAVPRLW